MFFPRAYALLAVLVLAFPLVTTAVELRNDIGQKRVSRVVRANYQEAGDDQSPASSLPAPNPTIEHQPEVIGSGVAPGEIIYEGDLQHEPFTGDMPGAISGDPMLGCGGCGDCCGSNRWWIDAEYLFWWRDGSNVPPLVTTAPSNPILGAAGTSILFGNEKVGEHARAGTRLGFGHWFDPCQSFGFEARYVWMGDTHTQFRVDASTHPVIGLPYIESGSGSNMVFAIASVDDQGDPTRTGGVAVTSSNDVNVWDVAFHKRLLGCGRNRVDFLVGYQGSRVDDDLRISSSTTIISDPDLSTGTQINQFDEFATTNEFQGVVIGLSSFCQRGPYSLRLRGSLAFGTMDQIVTIRGQRTTFVPPDSTNTVNEGLYAQSTNVGVYAAEEFAVLPELSAQLVWNITCRLDMNVGYSMLYWSDIVQAGDQIDTTLDLGDPPATARPIFDFHSNGYLVHGFSAGLSFRF